MQGGLRTGSYHPLTVLADGICKSFSGRRFISFMMLQILTGNSCFRNENDCGPLPCTIPEMKQGCITLILHYPNTHDKLSNKISHCCKVTTV